MEKCAMRFLTGLILRWRRVNFFELYISKLVEIFVCTNPCPDCREQFSALRFSNSRLLVAKDFDTPQLAATW